MKTVCPYQKFRNLARMGGSRIEQMRARRFCTLLSALCLFVVG